MSGPEYVQIKDLKPGMKNVNAVFIVLEVGAPTLTKEAREVRTLRVADGSAAVNLSVWDEPGALLQPGDIVRLTRGYASLWRAALTLYSGKSGDIHKIGEFCMLFNEQLNMSEPQPAPAHPAHPSPPAHPLAAAPAAASLPHAPHAPPAPGVKAERGALEPGAKLGHSAHTGHNAHKTYVRGRAHQRGGARR